MNVDVKDIINTLREEQRSLNERMSSIYGQQGLINKLIQYYTELEEKKER